MNVTFLKWPVSYYFIWSVAFDEGQLMAKQDQEAEWPEKDIYGILDKTIAVRAVGASGT